MQPALGSCCIVLHGHLPWVHHPDHDEFLEEDWYLEAVLETYLPLLFVLEDLERDGVPVRLTVGLTPPLLEMLRSPSLVRKAGRYLERRAELAEAETRRLEDDPVNLPTARHYADRYAQLLELRERLGGDLVAGFARHARAGRLELLASAATHAILPLLASDALKRAQIAVGTALFEEVFGMPPAGFWLPECAHAPGLDALLVKEGVRYVLLESHGVLGARPPAPGTWRPLLTPAGLAAFGRDQESSRQVWSSEVGYPGDPCYRELYRDLGYDAPYDYVRPWLHADGVRRNLGLKYHCVTGKVELHEKRPYDVRAARDRTRVHADHFLETAGRRARTLFERTGSPPVLLSPYDMELFGHWWYEGPHFLEALYRRLAEPGDRPPLKLETPLDVLRAGTPCHTGEPAFSTWGEEGYLKVWLNESNAWVLQHQQALEERMLAAAERHPDREEPRAPLLDQMLRELLLLQSSDWAFILSQETSTHYASKRVRDHVSRFLRLEAALDREASQGRGLLEEFGAEDGLFPGLDYRVLRGAAPTRPGVPLGTTCG